MKYILIFILLFSISFVHSNIVYPEIVSEIFFEGDEWYIELSNDLSYPIIVNPNEILLECSGGEAYLNMNAFLVFNCTLVIDQNDLTAILPLNKEGDYLRIESMELYEIHYWGDHPNSHVNQLYDGQSYVNYQPDDMGWLIKQNSATLGSSPYYTWERGTFSGYVYDANMQPLNNAEICCYYSVPEDSIAIITDENGYFEDDNLLACNYSVNLYYNGIIEAASEISIEPDSITYEEFVLNAVKIEDYVIPDKLNYSLFNYPNPFNPSTEISFQLSDFSDQNLEIQIFNSKGQKIKAISPSSCHPELVEGRGQLNVVWNGKDGNDNPVSSGVYLYKLVSNGKELAANKMLLLK